MTADAQALVQECERLESSVRQRKATIREQREALSREAAALADIRAACAARGIRFTLTTKGAGVIHGRPHP